MTQRTRPLLPIALLGLLAASSQADPVRVANPNIQMPANAPVGNYSLDKAFSGLSFNNPVCMASPPGDTLRLFVCEKNGVLKVIPDVTDPTPTSSTFLNLSSLLSARPGESINTFSESGLLGLAFHPDFANNGFFYIFYSVNKSGLHQRVSRFTVSSGNPNLADTSSELILIEQFDRDGNHNGGDLHFGNDGYLYISVGDEGGQNDYRDNSQTINGNFFSGILRINADRDLGVAAPGGNVEPTPHSSVPTTSGFAHYSIPVDNPFVHTSIGGTWDGTYNGSSVSLTTVRREFFATGMRNPWRMSFDSLTGELWCGDVGQDDYEEIDLVVKGGNYGWAYREADHNGPKSGSAPANFDTLHHAKPIHEYGRSSGYSVTGGRVYRGNEIPVLYGKYIFGDYGSGRIWSLERDGSNPPIIEQLADRNGHTAFGVDPSNGDILIADYFGDEIERLVSSTPTNNLPTTLSATGLFSGNVADLTPADGMVPYEVNLPFWSDHAIKRRWFIVPDGVSQFTWSEDGHWSLPTGAIWVKHFDIETERGNPATLEPIETRVLVKTATGSYGVSYRWNAGGTDADLVAQDGDDFNLDITVDSVPTVQPWRIPSRAECLTCHTPQAGHVLSFNTRQLNLDADILGCVGNQLNTLGSSGYFTNTPGNPNFLRRHLRPDETDFATEARVRSYLAVNCGYCHQPDGTAGVSNWDGRPEVLLADTGLLLGEAIQNAGDPANKLIVPGDTTHSVVLNRIAVSNGFTRMPPLGSNVLDQDAIDLLTEWINTKLPSRQTYADWRLAVFGSDPEGEPGLDPDFDGFDNETEFLHGTNPIDGSERPSLSMNSNGGLKLGFTLPENRSFEILSSEDLSDWNPWDNPANQGLPVPGSLMEIDVPPGLDHQFFSLEVSEN